MAKQLNSYEVKLDFKADTSQAKKEIQSLQDQLSNAINKTAQSSFGNQMSKEISDAIGSATKLKIQLQEAFNVDTGRLDLGKFKQSMDQSGMSLQKYQQQLAMLGPEGEQAFRQLASSVVQAEVPLKRSNALLKEFGTTLANTARWQISSSLLHGIMGAMSSAYGYAQDLNESLNNIRIVTGYSVDQMTDFAAAANRAAQALSTTTTAYTDAALIYYQQGLSDEEVLGRTDVTIKLANVARESAETVSDQMTAVWNNFYDGSKSLEYYADVMTALGAATASSTSEISQGLEKFAAVADTVGLSYEYATAALATVTATTRQSADIVGTAFKTLFARLEQLKLGETLDDGTTLGQYSQALEKVGVLIKDDAGNLKDMDDILDELAAKWQTLAKDQQVALAQQVAGVRQYTQLIALMDNWDFMQSNLEVARGAEGTLEEQADIYAESWEAAQKRVKAAAEEIYGALLNDEFFIDLNNMLADTIHAFGTLIKGMGGMKGVLTVLGAVFVTVFRDSVSKSIDDTIYRLKMMTKAGREALQQEKERANNMLVQSYEGKTDVVSVSMKSAVGQQMNLQESYLKYAQRMTEEERQHASILLNEQQTLIKNVELKAKEVQALEKANNLEKIKLDNQLKSITVHGEKGQWTNARVSLDNILDKSKSTGISDNFISKLSEFEFDEQNAEQNIKNLQKIVAEAGPDIENHLTKAFGENGANAFKNFYQALQSGKGDLQEYTSDIIALTNDYNPWEQEISKLAQKLYDQGSITEETRKHIIELAEAQYQAGKSSGDLADSQNKLANFTKQVGASFADLAAKNTTVTQSFVAMSGTFMTLASSIRMLTGLIDVWKDDSVSTGQKLLQTITVLSSVIMMASKVEWADTAAHMANIGAKILSIGKSEAHTVALTEETIVTEKLTLATLGYIAVAALVAAAIVGIIYLIYRAVTAEERQAKQLADTKEKAKELTDQYKDLKNSAEEFRNTISDYQDGLDELENLKDNQEELNKAIEESNKKAKELIETYKLFDDYTINTNGAIVINSEALDNIQKQKDLQVANVRATAAGAQINALNQERNFAFDNIKYDNYYNRFDDNQKQLLANEFKNYSEENAGIVSTEGFKKYIKEDTEFINTFGNKVNEVSQLLTNLNNLGIDSLKNYLNVVNETAEGMRHWTKELYSADFQAKNYEQLRTLSTVNGEFSQARYELISAVAGIKQDAIQIADTSSVISQSSLSNWISSEGHTDIATQLFGENWGQAITGKNLIANYAALHSGGNASDYDITKNSDGQYTAKNIYTQEEAVSELTEEAIAKLMAAEMAVKEAMNNVDYEFLPSLDTIIQKADEAGSKYGVDFSNALLSSLIEGEGSLQDFNLSSIMAGLDEGEWTELKSLTPEQLADLFGITEENLEALGLKSKEELHDKFQEGLGDNYNSIDNTESQNAIGEETAEKVGLNVEAFKLYREELRNTYPELAKNAKAANDVAIANMRLAKGVNSILDNWEEYNEILSDSNAQFEDVANVTADMKEALEDMLNIDASTFELLPPDFAQKNWKLITDAVNGVEGKVDELRDKAGEEILLNVAADDTDLQNKLLELHNFLSEYNNNPNFEINVPIAMEGNEEFYAKCQEIINAAGFTAEQAQKYFASMGYDVEFHEATTPEVTRTHRQHGRWFDPETREWMDIDGSIKEYEPAVKGTAIKTITPNGNYGGNVAVKRTGGGGGGSKGGGGGGKSSSPAESQKVTSKADAGIKRYKEIDDAIQDLTKDQERLNKVTDAYYGANKVAYMKQQHKLLQKEIDLHKERFKWAQKYYDEDKAELDKYAKETLGVEIEYDEDGSIKNYTPIMEDLFGQLNEKEKYWADASHFSSKEEQEEYKKANVDPIANAMKDFQKRVDTFDESNEERKEEMNKGIELMIEFKQQEYEIWQEGWKNQQDILEDQIKFLDHAKKMLGDSAADMGEALALTAGGDNTYVQNALDQLDLYKNKEQELNDLLAANKITQADYVKGMEEIRDGYLEQTENLKALDDEMMEYYGKILDKVISEIKEYTNAMDKLNSQLDRYMKVMKLTGRELDYDAIGDILEAQQKVLNDQYTTDVNTLQMLREREQHWLDELARQTTDEGRELIERQLKETREQLVETENQVLDDLAAQAEKAAEILENARAKSMAVYENMLTDGLGFDYVDGLLERQSTLQEEYLTKTNQVFETTKMLRKLQSDMDATNNRAAKQRLSNFSKEIEDLKNRESMTKADLELAQKRYDLLLAEIALEEAQKAKTTVRLQRDNEGNYGYVYTADEGDIAKAQDDLYNAENDLYNTRLRITNEYGEKIIQLNQEQADALNELWDAYYNKHSITEDEYEQKRAEIVNHYNELRKTYVHNYVEAQQNDARVVADAWINQDSNMIKSSETWQRTTDKLIAQTENAIRRYENTSSWLEGQQEIHFGNVEQETQKVTTASNELKDKVNEEVIPAYEDLWNKVDAVYKKYSDEREEVLKNITAYNDLATSLQTTINRYRELANASDIKTFNSDGDVKGTGTEVKDIPSNPTQPTGSTDKGKTPSYTPPYTPPKQQEQTQAKTADEARWTTVLTKPMLQKFADQYIKGLPADKNKFISKYLGRTKNDLLRDYPTRMSYIASLYTGGYTGEWLDNSGKLAVLHSKELVLNAKDTENMLAVVDMVREITKTIDVNAAGVIGGYGALSSGSMNAGPQTLEQNVQITASFPNATDHNEIEEAFNNLINKASQYANRTR